MNINLLAEVCTWNIVCSPYTPHTPFATSMLILWDTARVITILACVVTLVWMPSAFASCITHGQRARYFALLLWILQDITTESTHLGDFASIRLLFNMGAALLGMYGVYMMRKEFPARSIES